MSKRKRREYPEEFKEAAVKRAVEVGSIAEVARELDVNQATLRTWVEKSKPQGPGGALADVERKELDRLRREVKSLKAERDFLKKTSAYFAKDSERSK